ncbi:hypothetical protein LY78DRAFT_385596 [Colletotrichum sublineola]|nr:hypothetical protein LY78DRAFT_385596 [Colletotrichum sublineola]
MGFSSTADRLRVKQPKKRTGCSTNPAWECQKIPRAALLSFLAVSPLTQHLKCTEGPVRCPNLGDPVSAASINGVWYPIVRAHDGGIHRGTVSPFLPTSVLNIFFLFSRKTISSPLRVLLAGKRANMARPYGCISREYGLERAGAGRRNPDGDGIARDLGVAREQSLIFMLLIWAQHSTQHDMAPWWLNARFRPNVVRLVRLASDPNNLRLSLLENDRFRHALAGYFPSHLG